MDPIRRQQLAQRLHLLLLEQLGMGLDVQRMLGEPLYARDVLLVCAAHPGSELASLAWEFRDASAPARPARVPAPSTTRSAPPAAAVAATRTAAPQPTRQVPAAALARPAPEPPDSEPASSTPAGAGRSPRSRFSRLSLSRFGASIFGGSLFEGTLFGNPQANPITDFGDDSYLAPAPKDNKTRPAPASKGGSRWMRWFGR